MLDHGHTEAAIEYVLRQPDPAAFPFAVAAALIQKSEDPDRRASLLRRGIDASASRHVGRRRPAVAGRQFSQRLSACSASISEFSPSPKRAKPCATSSA